MSRHHRPIALAALLSTLAPALSPSAALAATPKPEAHANGTLTLRASLSHKVLPNRASSEVYASIKIKAGDLSTAAKKRMPMNLSVVIDRSTSMSGDKIKHAKEAAHKLIDLLGPNDRLAIVSYGSDVRTELASMPVTDANRELMHNAVNGIRLRGSTNLAGGFSQGCALARAHTSDGVVSRVILMSDGQANVGVTTKEGLGGLTRGCLNQGVSSSTMGVGLGYNEDLMTHMAKEGAGNYHFIENEKALAKIFTTEAQGLASTVAQNTTLTIDLAPGVEMLSLHGFSFRAKGNRVTIPLAEFFARQQKDLLLRLSISAQQAGERPVLTAKLGYKDLTRDKKSTQAAVQLGAKISGDKKLIAKNLNTPVISRAQQVAVSTTMEQAMTEYERGNTKGAVKLLEDQRSSMNRQRKEYAFGDDKAYDRVDKELKTMQSTIKQNQAQSAEGQRLRKSKKARSYQIQNMADAF